MPWTTLVMHLSAYPHCSLAEPKALDAMFVMGGYNASKWVALGVHFARLNGVSKIKFKKCKKETFILIKYSW